jgi:hypothetical protein
MITPLPQQACGVSANGDAAIDVLLEAHEFAAAGDLAKDRHTTVIHSQFVRAATTRSAHNAHPVRQSIPDVESHDTAIHFNPSTTSACGHEYHASQLRHAWAGVVPRGGV